MPKKKNNLTIKQIKLKLNLSMDKFEKVKIPGRTAQFRTILVFVVVFVLVGALVLFVTKASPFASSSEAEDGNNSGVAVVNDTNASGGKSIRFGGLDIATSSKPLPFDLPLKETLRSSSKLVLAHYFPPLPISIDNQDPSNDYYARNFLKPDGENGKHAAYGGHLRQRPLVRAPYTGTLATSANSATCPLPSPWGWRLPDMETEVRNAIAGGLDGFTLNVMTAPARGDFRVCQNAFLMLEAAQRVDPNFKIVIMPDMSGGLADMTMADFAAFVNMLSKYPSAYRLPDGRLVLAPFYPEKNHNATWWAQLFTMLDTQYGIKVAFVPCFLNYPANAAAFEPISYGFSNWGNRNPKSNSNLAANMADARSRGKIWMQAVSVQDARPRYGVFDEANNSENLRVTWNAAISGADWVQIPTWNDYTEGTIIAPSTHIGWSPLDITSYYLTRFKTGSWPTIKRDVIYVSHRIQPHAAQPTYPQTLLQQLRTGSSPARDTVEILSFLPTPATVTVKIGNNDYTYTAPAGVNSQIYPLALGQVTAKVTRGSTTTAGVNSPFPVISNPYVQDLEYYFRSSSREGSPN